MILQPPTAKVLLPFITAAASFGTVIVVQKCTATHTLELRTNAPIKDVARALDGTVSTAGIGVRIGAGFDASAQLSHTFSDGPAFVPTVAMRKVL